MREWGQEIVHKICLTNLSTSVCFDKLVIEAIYFIIIFDASVFPAPLSPKFKKNKKITQMWMIRIRKIRMRYESPTTSVVIIAGE